MASKGEMTTMAARGGGGGGGGGGVGKAGGVCVRGARALSPTFNTVPTGEKL